MAEIKEAAQASAVKSTDQFNIQESVNKLAKFGGFGFLESAVEGIASMNPERSARKKAFFE